MQTELLLGAAFIAGFLGSGHCFGMCGPVVVLLEKTAREDGRWLRRVAQNVGRLGFYVVLGTVAGAVGTVLTTVAGVDIMLRLLRLLAAGLVIAIGLNLLFDLRLLAFVERAGGAAWAHMAPLAKRFVPADTLWRSLAAGFVWGALPCGLVYSVVALAATTGDAAGGAATMFAFWAGTAPALLSAGYAASAIGRLHAQRWLRRASGALLIGIGLFALYMPSLMRGGDHSQHMSVLSGG